VLNAHDILLEMHKYSPSLLTLHALHQCNILQSHLAIEVLRPLEPIVSSLGVLDSLSDGGDVERLLMADLVWISDEVVFIDRSQVESIVGRRDLSSNWNGHIGKSKILG